MIRIEVGPGDLAASRFAISPSFELENLLRKLDQPTSRTAQGSAIRSSRWAHRYAEVHEDLDARVLRALRPPTWGMDFTCPPPRGMSQTPDDDLAIVRATPLSVAREQIRRALDLTGTVDPDISEVLARPDITGWLADALERMWHTLVAADWPQLLAIVERDVLHRADRLVRGGWGEALDDLHPTLRWRNGGVEVLRRPAEQVSLDGRGLIFVPSVFMYPDLVVRTEPPWHPGVVYPARGSAALWATDPPTPRTLERLLGPTRAGLLLRLDAPASTTQLSRATGHTLGAVGDHLRVLREAGLLIRSRAGSSVIYRRTAIGDALAAGAQ